MHDEAELADRVELRASDAAARRRRAVGHVEPADAAVVGRRDVDDTRGGALLHQLRQQVRQQEVTHVVGADHLVVALLRPPVLVQQTYNAESPHCLRRFFACAFHHACGETLQCMYT